MTENWIWLPENAYPDCQRTAYDAHGDMSGWRQTVAEFRRDYEFGSPVRRAQLRFSGDTLFQLYCNGKLLATGPACVGGDFLGNGAPRGVYYSYETEIEPMCGALSFFARVRMLPAQLCDYSMGHGGFMLSGELELEDGSTVAVSTDESWLARKNGAYCEPHAYDGRIAPDEYVSAQLIENIWNTRTAPIPIRAEWERVPRGARIELAPGETKLVELELDAIIAGFVRVKAETSGELRVNVNCRELEEAGTAETAVFNSAGEYRGFCLHSAGNLLVEAQNLSDNPARVRVTFIETCYPVEAEAHTTTGDAALDRVLATCAHTLRICRQTHHLDSPRHCEPLACTGDYYIESLMTPFSFGDMRLSAFDVLRTAELLERGEGRIFHTTYSLIWVMMLRDVYMLTGDRSLLCGCRKALRLLLERFKSYVGSNGLVETPPDYMFVDWIYIDGHSLHHPPKALGQTCLNMFYFGALDAARFVLEQLGDLDAAEECVKSRRALGSAINANLYDSKAGAYIAGLNTPTSPELVGGWMPENTSKSYIIKQPNILAACFGVCDDDTARAIIDNIMRDAIPGECQPYFLHFLLEAVYRLGLRERCTLPIIRRWIAPVEACPKGLAEGFVKPEPTYSFDHSHAWGGTPLYSLPKALLGLEILSPGMERVKLDPNSLGLERARVELLTPRGKLTCLLDRSGLRELVAPKGVEVIISDA